MNLPPPRPAADAADASGDEDRQRWLAMAGTIYDRLREGSRAQLLHAGDMFTRELGGTVWIQIPSRPARRPLPEAGFMSEAPDSLRIR